MAKLESREFGLQVRFPLWLLVFSVVVILSACSDSDSSRTPEQDAQILDTVVSDGVSTDESKIDPDEDDAMPVGMDMEMDSDSGSGMEMSMGDDETSSEPDRDPFIRRAVSRPATGFTLTDQNGDSVSLNEFRGKWIVVDWIYTNCMTVCPPLTGEMLRVRDALGDRFGSEVQFLSLTFDPERDDAATMLKYAQNVDADSDSWAWLTGTKAETDEIGQAFGVSYTPAEAMMGVAMFDHTALTIMIDPSGIERFHYYGVGWAQDMIDTFEILIPEVSIFDLPSTGETPIVGLSTEAAEKLSDGTSYYWEDWELDEGITMQSAHNFAGKVPTKQYFNARMDGLEENGWTNLGKEDENGEALGLYYMFKNSDSDYIGVGTNENVMVEVRGESFRDTLDALFWLGDALCCPA